MKMNRFPLALTAALALSACTDDAPGKGQDKIAETMGQEGAQESDDSKPAMKMSVWVNQDKDERNDGDRLYPWSENDFVTRKGEPNQSKAEKATAAQLRKLHKKAFSCRVFLDHPWINRVLINESGKKRTKIEEVFDCEPVEAGPEDCPVDVLRDKNGKLVDEIWC